MPTRRSGTCRAVRASRPQSLTDAGSAHWRSSMTRTTGRAVVSSMVSAMSCSASIAGTSAPRSVATSPRSSPAMAVRRAFADGRRTPRASRNGSRGSSWPSSSPAPQKTWQLPEGRLAMAVRTSVVLPMPGSPSMSTALPPPRARSLKYPSSSASSSARPASTPAVVTGCMSRRVLAGHLRNKRFFLGHEFVQFGCSPPWWRLMGS